MKPANATFALIVVLTAILASEPVLAKGGGRGGGRGGAHSGSHSRSHHAHARVIVGSAVILPTYSYYPPYYVPPVAMEPEPWGYIEQGSDAYYCAETQKYFPDAPECSSAWQLITPSPVPPT